MDVNKQLFTKMSLKSIVLEYLHKYELMTINPLSNDVTTIKSIKDIYFLDIYYSLGRRIPIYSVQDIQNIHSNIKNSIQELGDYYLHITLENIIFNYTILSEEQYNKLNGILNKKDNPFNLNKETLLKKLSYSKLPVLYDQYSQTYTRISKGLFKRRLSNNTLLYYKNNRIDLLTKEIENLKYMSVSSMHKDISGKIMTLDIETFIKEGFHIPYCISLCLKIKNNKDYYKTFILKNLNEDLFKQLFDYLLSTQFHQYTIYIHNSSSFDMIFLLKQMINHPLIKKINPIIKDNKFINLEIYFESGKKTYKISFRDSYLLLPSSLDKLSKAFNTKNHHKGIFPYQFVNKDNLLYEGIVPNYEYFDKTKVSLENYLVYKNQFMNNDKLWNLLEETKAYCELDCKSLLEVMISFQEEIFELFSIDINKTPTLPSLAFKIFRTHCLNPKEVPLINGRLYNILNQAYFGGHVDMYIPSNVSHQKVSVKDKIISLFNKVYHYDVNSLYPTGMKYLKFPTGKITHFICRNNESLALLNREHKLGVFRVNIECPKDLLHPIIPIKMDHACVYPVGNWQGWYHSEELINAEKYGYKYEILEGYLFESEPIFKDYIDKLYEIKVNSFPNTPHYIISKLLMNSLYGRFAMNPHLLNYQIVDNIDNNKPFEERIDLGNNKYLMTYYNESQSQSMNINIAIGLSVTAYARIIMSYFKNNLELTGLVYYTDTDSLFCSKELPLSCIGKEIGKMKLEHTLSRFIAIAPKVYGGIDLDGKSFTKVKGLKNKMTFEQLENLLIKPKDSELKIPLSQEKWYKSLKDGTIEIKYVPYILTPTHKKRILLFKEFILFTYHFNKFKIKVSMCNIETNIINLVF